MRLLVLGVCCLAGSLWGMDAWACKSDMDCKGDRICQAGQCTASVVESVADSSTDEALPKTSLPPQDEFTGGGTLLRVDVLGLLTLGVAPALEFGERTTGYVRLRLMNLGALTHLLYAYDSDESLEFSYGVAGGLRRYIGNQAMQGVYLGGGIEFVSVNVAETDEEDTSYGTLLIAPQVEVGYAWRFEEGFTVGVGLAGGVGLPIASEKTSPAGDEDQLDQAENVFHALFHIDLGFVL